MRNHVPEEEFLFEFFGNHGRILGNPPFEGKKRYFTDNPNDIFKCIEFAKTNKLPAFISVQPFRNFSTIAGIEKIFYDFDYGSKSDKFTEEEIIKKSKELDEEVAKFINMLLLVKITPLIVKTRKGYQIHIFLDRVYSLNCEKDFYRDLYKTLMGEIIDRYERYYSDKLKYLDYSSYGDVIRVCRIPLSIHQVSGEKCKILKLNQKTMKFEEEKLRGIGHHKIFGIKEFDVYAAIKKTEKKRKIEKEEREKNLKEFEEIKKYNNDQFKIRACFENSINLHEMPHSQRLALLSEAWYAGYRNSSQLIELFIKMNDFDIEKTTYYIEYFLKRRDYEKYPPYRCSTIQNKGWCLKSNQCEIWRKKYGQESKA